MRKRQGRTTIASLVRYVTQVVPFGGVGKSASGREGSGCGRDEYPGMTLACTAVAPA